MKHLKIYITALLALVAGTGLVQAQDHGKGQVQAAIVVGDVSLLDSSGKQTALHRGDIFEDGNTVICGPAGNTLLVFSNGATMKVSENGQLTVHQFDQADFNPADTGGTFMRLTKDPSKSTTELDLDNGTLAGEVKTLNTAAGSSFKIETPAGSAGIRGTIVSFTVVRNAAGQVIGVTSNCFEGAFVLSPHAITRHAGEPPPGGGPPPPPPATVSAGGQVQISVTVAPPGTPNAGQITGITIGGAALSTATSVAALADIVSTINIALQAAGQPTIAPPPPPPPTAPTGANGSPPPPTTAPGNPNPPTTTQPTPPPPTQSPPPNSTTSTPPAPPPTNPSVISEGGQ